MKISRSYSGSIFSIFLALIITFIGIYAQASQARSAASGSNVISPLIFDSKEHNFGEILQGDKVTHVFKFKNSGDEPVKLGKVSASCGCTATTATRGEIGPGEEGEVKATFNSTGRRGKQKKAVYVATAGNYAKQTLSIQATIIIEREILPTTIQFGMVKELQSSKQTATIYNRKNEPWTITEAAIKDNERIKILKIAPEPPFTIPPQSHQPVIFTMITQLTGKASDFSVPISGGIPMSTDDRDKPRLNINYKAEMKQDLLSSPKRVYFPGVMEGAAMSKVLSLKNQTAGPINIIKCESTGKDFEILLENLPVIIKRGTKMNVPVRFKGNITENSVSAMLKFTTDSARQPLVEIPVTALLKNRVTYGQGKQ
jgi:uncharacterized protein DUF1573